MSQTVGSTWSAFVVETKLFLVADGFEKVLAAISEK
jgi:hypothetical protein